MRVTNDYREEIISLSKDMPENKLRELADFARFLKTQRGKVVDMKKYESSAIVHKLRKKEGKRAGSGSKFIQELLEWQKSNS